MPAAYAVSQRAGGNCVVVVSVRHTVLQQPEPVESAAWLLLSGSYAALGMGGSAVGDRLQPQREGTAKQVNRSADESNYRKGRRAVYGCLLLDSSVGQGYRLGSGYQVKRTVRLG